MTSRRSCHGFGATRGAVFALKRAVRDSFRIVRLIRVSIFGSLLGSSAILAPDQFSDALKSVAEFSILQLCATMMSAWIAAASIALSGQFVVDRLAPQLSMAGGTVGWMARRLPVAMALLLVVAIVLAVGRAVHNVPMVAAYTSFWDLGLFVGACGIMTSLAFLSSIPWATKRSLPSGLALAGGLFTVFAFLPVALPAWLGPLSIVLLWIAAVTWLATAVAFLFAGTKFPIFICLAAMAVLFGYFDVNDNHLVRHARRTDFARGAHLSDVEFDGWLGSRTDKLLYAGRNYPVFIVSAEGGGMRAAYFSALVLSSMQDRCPAFAQHVFAISGVSGGSVGAAVFAGLVKRFAGANTDVCPLGPTSDGEFQRVAERVLRHDLFSPLLAALLFPDFIQRILPWPIQSFDRARAFEYALERAWHEETKGDEFAQSFFDLSAGWRAGTVPALVLNTTNVETGMRMAISHLDIHEENDAPLETLLDVDAQLTLPLSTAAGLSARFPLVAPAGHLLISQGADRVEKRRYVDGGYFENSGTSSVFDIFNALRVSSWAEGRKVDLYILRIGSPNALPRYGGHGFGELLSPIRTLLNTREARGTVAKAQMFTSILDQNRISRSQRKFGVIDFELQQRTVPLPLGWSLSKSAREEIAAQLNQSYDCDKGVADVTLNSCSRDAVLRILRH